MHSSGKYFVKHIEITVDHIRRLKGLEAPPATLDKRQAQRRSIEQLLQGGADIAWPPRIDVARCHARHFRQACQFAAYDRRAELHRLEQWNAKALVQTWKQQAEGAAPQRSKVLIGHEADDVDPSGEAHLHDGHPELPVKLEQIACEDEMKWQFGPFVDELSEANQEQTMIFVRPAVGRIERVGRVADAKPGAHVLNRSCRGWDQPTVDRDRDRAHTLGGESESLNDLTARELGDADDEVRRPLSRGSRTRHGLHAHWR